MLSRLRLSHFRSHKWLEVEPGIGPVAIYGANGAGKTNILEAVSLLSPGRGLRRAAAEDFARTPERVGWKVMAELSGVEVASWAEPGAPRQVEIGGKPAPQLALGRLARVLWLTPAMDRLWTEGAAERRRFLDRVALSFQPEHGAAALAYEKAMRERNRLLKDGVREPGWFAALEAQMAEAGAVVSANRAHAVARLETAQASAETAFPRADVTVVSGDAHPPDHSKDSLAAALAEGRAQDQAAGRTLTGPHRADLHVVFAAKNIEARFCSTGEQKALLLSLVLANARGLAAETGSAPVLLLDEVAAHLDAGRRASLYAEIAGLGAQAWMTGTGPELFHGLENALRLSVSEGHDGSEVEVV